MKKVARKKRPVEPMRFEVYNVKRRGRLILSAETRPVKK